jgi:peptidoglycan/xylan/chitin deacetylase (PgdA/CDA1 family)
MAVMKPKYTHFIKNALGIIFYYGGIFHAFRVFNNLFGRRLTIVMYHRVTEKKISEIEKSLPYLFTNRRTFSEQMKFLKRLYRIINFQDLALYYEKNCIPWNSLIITFDDGYEDFYAEAYPVLKEQGLSATVFITTNMMGENNSKLFWWDRAYSYLLGVGKCSKGDKDLPPGILAALDLFEKDPSGLFSRLNRGKTSEIERMFDTLKDKYPMSEDNLLHENRMLSWKQVIEMGESIEVGSHTCSHDNLLELGDRERAYEIKESKKIIGRNIKRKVIAFSYPSGSRNNSVKRLVEEAGYEFAVTTNRGVNNMKDCYNLKRINVWEGSSLSAKGKFSGACFSLEVSGIRFNL